MGRSAGPRWLRTMTGYTGLGGLRSVWAMLTDRTPSGPEDLTLADVMADRCGVDGPDGRAGYEPRPTG